MVRIYKNCLPDSSATNFIKEAIQYFSIDSTLAENEIIIHFYSREIYEIDKNKIVECLQVLA